MIIDNCQTEYDRNRGVLYVHAPNGHTLLRICGLPTTEKAKALKLEEWDQIDITYPERVQLNSE